MVTANPIQEVASQIKSLQDKVGDLQEKARLNSLRDSLEDVQTNIQNLPQKLSGLRTRGYVFEKDLEDQAQALVEAWAMQYPNLQAQVNAQSSVLVNALRPIEMQMPQLASAASNPMSARGLLGPLEAAVDQLESKIDATKEMIDGMYDQLSSQASNLERHLDEIDSLLKNISEASFTLLPTESGIMAVKAVWCRTGEEKKDDPEGILYLTDQRMLFEQKEDVATKKVLFVTTEKKRVQNLLIEAPIALVDKIGISKAGMFKNEDHLDIGFLSGAQLPMAHFHIWQDCATWQGLINRAKTKDFEAGRTIALDQAAVEKVKSAPTQCPSCGGAITKPVLRGQDTIKCEFCGYEIRL